MFSSTMAPLISAVGISSSSSVVVISSFFIFLFFIFLIKVVISSSSSSARKSPKHDSKWYALVKRCTDFKRKKKTPVVRFKEATALESSHGLSWTKVRLLGKGGFGSVFYAKTRTTNNQKTNLPSEMAVKSAIMLRSSSLIHEKRVLCHLRNSPHVVRFYGHEVTVTANGVIVYNLLLEYCSGLSLQQQIRKSDRGLAESDVRSYSRDILRGLKYIHSRGYIHCDIKPANILLVPGRPKRNGTFRAKIADFGVAKAVNEECHNLRGTLRFMSPESVRDKKIEYATDIWAFGCVVLEMLTAKSAWGYRRVKDLKDVIGYTDEMPKIPTNISDNAKDFLSRCLVRIAAYRWSADMLLQHPFLSVN